MDTPLIPYGEAVSRLHGRFPDLDPGELNLWVWANELSAYRPNGSPWYWAMARNLSDIVEARFRADEIDQFAPKRRYVSYRALVDRWKSQVKDATPDAFIKERLDDPAQLREKLGRLTLFPFDVLDCSSCPPSSIESRMFSLDQIEAAEADWFESKPESANKQRRRRCLDAGEAWRKANHKKTRSELTSFLQEQFGEIPTAWIDKVMAITPDIPRNRGGRPRKVNR